MVVAVEYISKEESEDVESVKHGVTGILAVQGAFAEHAAMLDKLGAPWKLLRAAEDFDESIDRVILPGGESTVMGKLLRDLDLFETLQEKIRAAGGDPDRETLHFIKTKDGAQYYTAPDGDYFRAYVFVKDSISYDAVESAALFQKSGEAFGRFQHLLADFPAETLYETIPNFHNTLWRYENEFLPAVEADKAGRAAAVQAEIQFVKDRKADTHRLSDLAAAGQLPLRVTHNDTKLNNVLFDATAGEAICVIDLDTVMPGLAHYDFGDSIRFGANTAAEDEADLSKVSLDLEYFGAYAKGFLSQAGESLTQTEIDQLAFSAKLMTFECGMRFLTDYLNGDTYFKTAYPEHNLVRARNQFALVADMERKMNQMEALIAAL